MEELVTRMLTLPVMSQKIKDKLLTLQFLKIWNKVLAFLC